MTTILDQLQSVEQLLSQLVEMNNQLLHTAFDEGFQSQPPKYVGNLSPLQWANAMLFRLEDLSHMVRMRLELPDWWDESSCRYCD